MKSKVSEHIRQRTREWFRKSDHELAMLLSQCEMIASDFSELRECCANLNKYKTVASYPAEPPIVIEIKEAKRAVEHATTIHGFCLEKARDHGY